MKKLKWLAPILIVSLLFEMVACKQSIEPHLHVFAKEWTSDAAYHWHASTCGHEVTEGKAEHEYEWTVTKKATCTEEGTKTGTCKVCKKEVTETIDAKGHCYGEYVSNNDATTEKDGTKTRECEVCENKETVADEGSKICIPEGYILASKKELGIIIQQTEFALQGSSVIANISSQINLRNH